MRADAKLMKELNKRQLRRVLRQCGEATKPELADRTGLSVVTINSCLLYTSSQLSLASCRF